MSSPAFQLSERLTVFRLLGRLSSGQLLWLLPMVGIGLEVICSSIEGTLIQKSAFHAPADLLQFLGFRTSTTTHPTFSLSRDIPSILLTLIFGFTVVCVYCQSQALEDFFPDLERNRRIEWRPGLIVRSIPERVLVRVVRRRSVDVDPAEAYAAWTRARLDAIARIQYKLLIISVLIVLLLQLLESKIEIFASRAPSALTPRMRGEWAMTSYGSWWASWGHPAGFVAYTIIFSIGLYVVLLQNAIATTAALGLIGLPAFGLMKVDWLDKDGAHGWTNLRKIFRFTYWSLMLRGATLALLAIALGIKNVYVLATIAGVWVLFLTYYLIIPFQALSCEVDRVKTERLAELSVLIRSGHSLEEIAGNLALREEIRYVREARLHPMMLSFLKSSGFVVIILLPVSLTVVQIVTQS